MEAMRQSWSDDRLDDLNNRVDVGFARVDERFAQMEERMDTRFARLEAKIESSFDRLDAKFEAKIESCFDRLDAKFEAKIESSFDRLDSKIDATAAELRQQMQMDTHQLNSRFDAMQQTFIRVGGGLIGVLFASGAGLIATQL
jgi:hypothetical protein